MKRNKQKKHAKQNASKTTFIENITKTRVEKHSKKVHLEEKSAPFWCGPLKNNSDHQNDIHVSLKRSVTKTSLSTRKVNIPKKHTLPVLTRTTLNINMETPQKSYPIRKGNSSSKFSSIFEVPAIFIFLGGVFYQHS